MAQGVFEHTISTLPGAAAHFSRVDSCGTAAYHVGSAPDPRTTDTLRAHGIRNFQHRARQLQLSDFDEFDYIFAMDRQNLRDIESRRPKGSARAEVRLFGEGEGEVVEDPYYGGGEGFQVNYRQLDRGARAFVEKVLAERKG